MAPILFNGAQMPKEEMLPKEIRGITKINCFSTQDENINACLAELVDVIKLGLEYAKFQAHDRRIKSFWAANFAEDFRGGKLKKKGKELLCQKCNKYFDSEHNDFNSCSFHPDNPETIGNAGPGYNYAGIWKFPCCGQIVKGDITSGGVDIAPGRSPGCMTGMHSPYK